MRSTLWLWSVERQALAWLRKARATVSKRAKLSNIAADLADHERACGCPISRGRALERLCCPVPCSMLRHYTYRSSARCRPCSVLVDALRAGLV